MVTILTNNSNVCAFLLIIRTVRDSSSSYKIDYVIVIKNFLYPKGHTNPISGSKVTVILLKGKEGSAPTAYAAGLFNHLRAYL